MAQVGDKKLKQHDINKHDNNLAEHDCVQGHIEGFLDEINNSIWSEPVPTGFFGVDDELYGGFYPGLYIVGAISSLGKTAWALQVMDYAATKGFHCLIFSLEMS